MTDPNSATRGFGFDDGGRMITATDAENRVTSFAYDAVGRRIGMTDARGVTVTSTFDDAGQLTAQVSPNETRSFTYDDVGRRTQMVDGSGTTAMVFDDVGRLTEVTTAAGTVGYGFNASGEQITMTQPEGIVTQTFDANGFPATVSDWRGDTFTMVNDADGRMETVARSNGVDTAYTYDSAGRLTSIGHSSGATLVDSFTYSLDGNGNRTGVTSSAGAEAYTLDALNRITAATYPGGVSEAFSYDPAGNRTSHTDTAGVTVGYTVDATGQLVSDTTGTTYTYDDAGNLTATSTGDVFVYDDFGRMSSATANGVTQTYGYDAAGVRVDVDGTGQLWDRNGLPTLISTGTDNYVHAAGIARTNDDWLLADAVGSVRAVTNNAGVTVGSQDFTVYGEQLSGTGTFGFAGEQQDPTGLIHLRARQYNPAAGRFTSVDSVQPGAPGTTGWNLYTYAGNNPSTWTDPSGRLVEAASTYKPVQTTAPAIAGVGLAVKTKLILGAIAIGSSYAVTDCVLAMYGIDAGPGCSSAGEPTGNSGPDDRTELIDVPSPHQHLADAYGIDVSAIEYCLLNFKKDRYACSGLPEDLIRDLLEGRDDLTSRDDRTIVFGQDGLLLFAEEAAGGSLDDLTERKPGFFQGVRASDGALVDIEWEPVGHPSTTNEGPHVTVREWVEDDNGRAGWRVVAKAFIIGQERFHE